MKALTAVLDLVPSWLWFLITVGALAAAGVSQTRFTNERANHAETREDYANKVSDAEAATRAQSEKNRAIEQELIDAQETHAVEVAAIRSELDAARDRARVESGRVRNAARAYAQRASAQCADATATELRASAADALDVLADVFSRAEQRATELAGQADGSRIAGLACEAHYDRVRAVISKH